MNLSNFKKRPTNPLDAIVAKCLDCCGYAPLCDQRADERDYKEANIERQNCLAENCPLFDFRMGKNPFKKAYTISEEERARRKENFK